MAPRECVAEGMCPDQGSEEVYWKKRCFGKNNWAERGRKIFPGSGKIQGLKDTGVREHSRVTEATEAGVGGWLSFILRAI